jgi:hypothetical protein
MVSTWRAESALTGGSALNRRIPGFRTHLVYGFRGLPAFGFESRWTALNAIPKPPPTSAIATNPTHTVLKTPNSSRDFATKRPRPSPASRPPQNVAPLRAHKKS